MKAFLLTFDYTTPKAAKLNAFHARVKSDPKILSWWHRLQGTYILITTDDVMAENLRAFFHQSFPDEYCFFIQIHYADYGGWLPKEAWDWMNSTLLKVG